MKRSVLFLSVLLLLPVAAAESSAVHLTSSYVEMEGGNLDAPLTILRVKISPDEVLPADFRLVAPSLHLELDHTDAASGNPASYYHDPQTTSSSHRDATLSGTTNRVGGAFYLYPLQPGSATISVQGLPCAGIEPSLHPIEATEANIRERPPRSADTTRSLRFQPCTEALHVTILGDVWLQLWNWDSVLDSDQGTQAIRTGLQDTQGVQVGSAQEAFIEAREASLSFTLTTNSTWLYAQRVEGAAITKLRATDAHGAALQRTGQDVELEGRFDVLLEGDAPSRPFTVDASGAITTQDQSTAVAPAAPGSRLLVPALLVALLGLLVVGGVAANRPERAFHRIYADPTYTGCDDRSRRERRLVGRAILARQAQDAGRHHRARRQYRHLTRHVRDPVEALLSEGEVCLNLGHLDCATNAFTAAQSDPIANKAQRTRALVGLAAVDAAQQHHAQAENILASDTDMDLHVLGRLLRANRVFEPIRADLLMEWLGQEPDDAPYYA